MSIPNMNDMIQALKRCVDEDGFLELDPEQTKYFQFFLYELLEREPEMRDGMSVRFAIQDFLGVMPDANEESA